jgi:acetylornithine deacetylase
MKSEIRNYMETNKAEFFKTIQELVQIETVVGNEAAGQAFMRERFSEIGLEMHEVVPDYEKLSQHEAFVDSGIPFEGRKNLVGIHRGSGNGRSLTLHGHIDVVSPGALSNWTVDPWGGEIKDGKLYGRGAADMKSGLLANWFALKALIDLGYDLKGDVQLHCVIEEEAGGGGGALACMEAGFLTDGYISTEPHNFNMTISHAGVMYFKVMVEGKTAHAGLAHHGVNAIVKMNKIIAALDELNAYRAENVRFDLYEAGSGQSVHLNIGVMQAGDWASTVPGDAVLECRIGFIPGETRADIRKLVEDTVQAAVADDPWFQAHPVEVEWFSWSTEAWYQDPAHTLVTSFKAVAEDVMGREVPTIGRAAGNDARFTQYYDRAGICFGPIGHHMHGPDEHVELDSVLEVANVYANYILAWTGEGK